MDSSLIDPGTVPGAVATGSGFREIQALSKSAKEYSIHSASLDGDEFRSVGASPALNAPYSRRLYDVKCLRDSTEGLQIPKT